MTTYERYCAIRDQRGLKDGTIATATKIGRSTFSDWKNGRSQPKQEKLQRIADYLETTIDYLLNGTESSISESNQPEPGYVFDNPDMRLLFDVAKDLNKDDLRRITQVMKAWRGDYD